MYGRRGEGSDGIVCPPSHGVWGGGVEEKKKKKKVERRSFYSAWDNLGIQLPGLPYSIKPTAKSFKISNFSSLVCNFFLFFF